MKMPVERANRPRRGAAIGAIVLFVALGLAGCSSPQLRYHTLMPLPQASDATVNGDSITIGVVTVPPQVNRSELVIRQDSSGLMVLESDWWGASLADEIRSTLVARLAQPGERTGRVRVSVTVTRFDSVPGDSAWLEASFRLIAQDGGPDHSLTCSLYLRNQAGGGVESLVIAHQKNVQVLADHIAAAARHLKTGATECP